jgi:hypothetical protein
MGFFYYIYFKIMQETNIENLQGWALGVRLSVPFIQK